MRRSLSVVRPLRSQAGNTLLLLLVVAACSITITYFLSGMMTRLNTMNRDTSRKQLYEATITSLLNYTRAAIKRKWCFSPTWENDSIHCDLTHPMSTERIGMTDDQQTHVLHNPKIPHATPL